MGRSREITELQYWTGRKNQSTIEVVASADSPRYIRLQSLLLSQRETAGPNGVSIKTRVRSHLDDTGVSTSCNHIRTGADRDRVKRFLTPPKATNRKGKGDSTLSGLDFILYMGFSIEASSTKKTLIDFNYEMFK